MLALKERLNLEIIPIENSGCVVTYGEYVDSSIFARISCSFAELSLDIQQL